MEGFNQTNDVGATLKTTLHTLLIPMKFLGWIIKHLGQDLLPAIMLFKMMNMILPVTQINTLALTIATEMLTVAESIETIVTEQQTLAEQNKNFVYSEQVHSKTFPLIS